VFFQAEDGIRDFHVTGVQTCALPILASQVVLNNPNMWRIIYNNSPLRGGFDVVIKGEKVNFLNRAENAVTVEWDLGNGSVSRERSEERRVGKRGGRGSNRAAHDSVTQ